MKILMIGSGSIAGLHARALQALDHTLGSVVGRRAEQTAEYARTYGFQSHGIDLDAALDDPTLEAAAITSPSEFHVEHARKTIARGLPTLLEIPVALSLADAEALDREARTAGVPLMAAHTRRFQPALRRVQQMIARGDLRVHHVIQRYGFLRRANVNWVGYERSWTDNLIWHHGGHAMDALLWAVGAESAEVTAQLGGPHDKLGIPMDIAIALRTPQGVVGNIALSYNTHQALDDALFIAEEDTIHADYATGRLTGKDGVVFDAKMSEVVPHEVITAQDREFSDAVQTGREPLPGIRDVLPSLRALQQVQDSYAR